MANEYKTGSQEWGDADDVQGGKFEKRVPLPVLKMSNGQDYRVRIISKPYRYYASWVELSRADGSKIKMKINSSLTPDCPLNELGVPPKLGRYIKVIYRNPGGKAEYRVLDAGTQIYNGIKKIQKNPDYGQDVSKYDITISKGPKGQMPLYNILPSPPTALSDDDKLVAQKANVKEIEGKVNPEYIDLEERCKPFTVEVIRKIIQSATTPKDGKGGKPSTLAAQETGVFGEEEGGEAEGAAAKAIPAVVKAAPTPAAVAAIAAPAKVVKPAGKADGEFLDF